VDDVPEVGRFFVSLARRIRAAPMEVHPVDHGGRALDLARAEAFDLVVSDLQVREVGGLEVLGAARKRNPRGLRWLMTGSHDVPAAGGLLAAGVDARVQKPLCAHDLLRALEDALRRDRARDAPPAPPRWAEPRGRRWA
jgi:CheY-like chemotaxis protein